MLQNLSKIQQRCLAIGLLIGVIVLVLALVIWPWYAQIQAEKEEITKQTARIQRYTRIIQGRDDVSTKVEQSKQDINALGYFNDQPSAALASADLQAFIKNTIVNAGGVLESTQDLPPVEEEDLIHIAVNVRLSGDTNMLRTILYTIETAKPLKLIEELDVRPMRGVRNHMTGQLEDTGTVSVNIQIGSYMRKNQ